MQPGGIGGVYMVPDVVGSMGIVDVVVGMFNFHIVLCVNANYGSKNFN